MEEREYCTIQKGDTSINRTYVRPIVTRTKEGGGRVRIRVIREKECGEGKTCVWGGILSII